jgi:hypothetical protein
MHVTNEITLSEVRREAQRRLTNRYFSDEQCDALLKQFDLPQWKKNYGDDLEESNRRFKIEINDAILSAQEQMVVFDTLEELREQCRWDYDEEKDEERKRSDEEFQREWDRSKLEKVMPGIIPVYERVYAMPEPFRHWDSRNRFQQWYFIQRDNKIEYHQGGSGSSQQREKQGRYGHVFAVLSSHHNMRIPTYVLIYDETNRLLLMQEYESFKAVDQELVGNYRADWKEINSLFDGMLLTVDHSSAITREKG